MKTTLLFKFSSDCYRVVAVSTAHLDKEARDHLENESRDSDMILARDTGWFLKLYEEFYLNNTGVPCLDNIIHAAQSAGFLMIEFDRDATTYSDLEVYYDY